MEINAIMLKPIDKVVTVVEDVKKGDIIKFKKEKTEVRIEAIEDIVAFHKIAIVDMKKDEQVIKYGQIIGAMTEDAKAGSHISHKNIMSLPRNYECEF